MAEKRGYQTNFSEANQYVFDLHDRKRKADTMLEVFFDQKIDISKAKVLNVGGGAGAIDYCLSDYVAEVYSLDIDFNAVSEGVKKFACPNMLSLVGDGMNLPFPDDYFDVVICSHVYEHVPNAKKLMDEIYRVLACGGFCYFSAGNRFQITEPHYKLPFLSVMPRPFAHIYMRVTGKGKYYYEKHLSLIGLKRLVKRFEVLDYSQRMIQNPRKYKIEYMLPDRSVKLTLARFVYKHVKFMFPGFIWVLYK